MVHRREYWRGYSLTERERERGDLQKVPLKPAISEIKYTLRLMAVNMKTAIESK